MVSDRASSAGYGYGGGKSGGYGTSKGSSASSKGYGGKSSGGHKGMNRPEVAASVQKASLRPERPQSKPQFMNDVQQQRQREQFQEQRRELSKPSPDWTGPKRNVPIGQSYGVRGKSRGPFSAGFDPMASAIANAKQAMEKSRQTSKKGVIPTPTPRPGPRGMPKSPGLVTGSPSTSRSA